MDMNTWDPTGVIDALVGRIFRIEDITHGGPQQGFLVRYRGHLVDADSAGAYERLAEWLKPHNMTPLFRQEGDRQVILLVQGVLNPKPSNPMINLVLFILTLFSVLLTGALYGMSEGDLPKEPLQMALALLNRGWPFALSLLAILASHEFGHYLMGRHHKVHVTLPYFIPLPFSLIGTMGAFINMKTPPRNRRQLLDIGLAGPLAGLAVTIPVLFLGLHLSPQTTLPSLGANGAATGMEGNSLLYLLSKYLVFGRLLPAPVTYGGMAPIVYWVGYFFSGRPYPAGGADVLLGPVAWAAWVGLLMTGLNLIPAGQLDGGHILYVLLGEKRAKRILPFILVALMLLGIFWFGWFLWAALIFFLGRAHAEPMDQITQLDGKRKLAAALGLLVFILTFTPVPLS